MTLFLNPPNFLKIEQRIAEHELDNLIDRILYGNVIDFIDWHWYDHHWPTFNIADSGITVGTILLLVTLVLTPGERPGDKQR